MIGLPRGRGWIRTMRFHALRALGCGFDLRLYSYDCRSHRQRFELTLSKCASHVMAFASPFDRIAVGDAKVDVMLCLTPIVPVLVQRCADSRTTHCLPLRRQQCSPEECMIIKTAPSPIKPLSQSKMNRPRCDTSARKVGIPLRPLIHRANVEVRKREHYPNHGKKNPEQTTHPLTSILYDCADRPHKKGSTLCALHIHTARCGTIPNNGTHSF